MHKLLIAGFAMAAISTSSFAQVRNDQDAPPARTISVGVRSAHHMRMKSHKTRHHYHRYHRRHAHSRTHG